MTHYETTCFFENGSLESSLTFRDGNLVSSVFNRFRFGSATQLEKHLNTANYLDEAVEFATAFCAGDYQTAASSVHPLFVENFDEAKFVDLRKQAVDCIGTVSSIKVVGHEVVKVNDQTRLIVELVCSSDNGELTFTCSYVLADFRMDLINFNFNAKRNGTMYNGIFLKE